MCTKRASSVRRSETSYTLPDELSADTGFRVVHFTAPLDHPPAIVPPGDVSPLAQREVPVRMGPQPPLHLERGTSLTRIRWVEKVRGSNYTIHITAVQALVLENIAMTRSSRSATHASVSEPNSAMSSAWSSAWTD